MNRPSTINRLTAAAFVAGISLGLAPVAAASAARVRSGGKYTRHPDNSRLPTTSETRATVESLCCC